MDAFFLTVAQDTGCKCVRAADNIRRHAKSKRTATSLDADSAIGRADDRKDSAIFDEDKDLLFTHSSLLQALGSAEIIGDLLQCRCSALCGISWRKFSPQDDKALAQAIIKQLETERWKLEALAVLVLSGCLFALRALHLYDCRSLETYLEALQREGSQTMQLEDIDPDYHPEGELRTNLFDRLLREERWARETIQTMTTKLLGSVKDFLWLVRIPTFEVSAELRKFQRKMNLPFIDEKQIPSPPLGRRYLYFNIAKEYLPVGLEDRRFFRKELSFLHGDSRWRQEADNEVKMLGLINGLKHRNIAKMLFCFEEWSNPRYAVSVVFDYHEYNLAFILHEPSSDPRSVELLNQFGGPTGPDLTLEHKLWRASLEIVDAVKSLHEFNHERVRRHDQEVLHAAHFDVKPANILIDLRRAGQPRLLLTDFGRAHLHRTPLGQSSGHAGAPATYDYAPPESLDDGQGVRLHKSYDTWSLGCVLLEILIHLFKQYGDASDFYDARLADSPEGDQNAAFWSKNRLGLLVLRSSVAKKLSNLENSNQPSLVQAAGCIKRMLSIQHPLRPPLKDCLEEFQTVAAPNAYDWVGENQRPLMESELPGMATSCWKPGFARRFDCNIYYCRELRPHVNEEVTLMVQRMGSDIALASAPYSHECLSPVSLFDDRAVYGQRGSTNTLRYAFKQLHKGLVLSFGNGNEYCDFFTLMTHQRIRPRSSLGLPIIGCRLHVRRFMGRDRVEQFGTGRVQLWNTLTEQEYNNKFDAQMSTPRSARTSQTTFSEADSGPTSMSPFTGTRQEPDAYRDRFKLAIFTSTIADSSAGTAHQSRPVCIVIELGSDNIELDRSTEATKRLALKKSGDHSSFPAALFEPSVEVKSSAGHEAKSYPAIPISPSVLSDSVRNSNKGLKSLELDFLGPREQWRLWALLQEYNVL